MTFINTEVLDDAREALRSGIKIEVIAGRLRIAPEYLKMLLRTGQGSSGKQSLVLANRRHRSAGGEMLQWT